MERLEKSKKYLRDLFKTLTFRKHEEVKDKWVQPNVIGIIIGYLKYFNNV